MHRPNPAALRLLELARVTTIAVAAAVFLLILELGAFSSLEAPVRRRLMPDLAALFFLLLPFAILGLILIRPLYDVRDRWTSLRRWLFTVLLLPAGVYLGFKLAEGGGVKRSGLATLVRLGVPLVWAGLSLVTLGVFAAMIRRGPWRASALLLFGGLLLHELNRRYFVGLYQPVHHVVFCIELGLFLGLTSLILRSWSVGRVGLFALGWSLAAASWALTSTPEPNHRSLIYRRGFHSARLLSWKEAWFPPALEPDSGPEADDREFLERWESWADKSRHAAEQFAASRAGEPPLSFLLISVDTLRPDRIGAYRKNPTTPSLTPNLDALAAEGILCERAWAQYPSTHFSIESLFLGRYPTATPLYRAIKGLGDPKDQPPVLPLYLRQQGFTNVASIAFTEEWMKQPLFRDLLAHFDAVNPGREGHPSYDARWFADVAIRSLEGLKDRRFFLWLHLFDPHADYEFREGLATSSEAIGRYDGEVRHADAEIGRVLNRLKDLGLDQSTAIAVVSDHGEAFGEHGGVKYHGSSLYDEQIRVPQIWRVPGITPRRIQTPVENVDLLATAAAVLALKDEPPNQGTSLLPLFLNDAAAAEFPAFACAELPDDVRELSAASSNLAMLVDGSMKIIRHLEQGWHEVYDLDADPGETNDVSARDPEQANRLLRRLMTVRRANARFGRSEDPDTVRQRRTLEVRAKLVHEKPELAAAGITSAMEFDLRELAPEVLRLAESDTVAPELRALAIHLLDLWNHPKILAVAASFVGSEDPALIWLGWKITYRRTGRAARPPEGSRSEWLQRPARRLAGDGEPGDPEDFLVDPQVSEGMALHPPASDGLLPAWVAEARPRLMDRYLDADSKRRTLDLLPRLPRDVAQEFAAYLLAAWDPEFHREARAKIAALWGDDTALLLERARALENDARELQRVTRLDEASAAFASAAKTFPSPAGKARMMLESVKMLLGVKNSETGRVMESFLAEVETLRRSEAAAFCTDLLEAADLVQRYRPEDGLLDERVNIQVTGVSGAPTGPIETKDPVRLVVQVRNHSDRALPPGAWPRGGRVRVLWQRSDGGGDILYGTDLLMERPLFPAESRTQVVMVEAPAEPGLWKGRIIVYQHLGARFHWSETAASEFLLETRLAAGLAAYEWSGDALMRRLGLDAGIHRVGRAINGLESVEYLVFPGHELGFTLNLGPDGFVPQQIRVNGRWISNVSDNSRVYLTVQGAGGRPLARVDTLWTQGETRDAAVFELPECPGAESFRFVFGPRLGVLLLNSLQVQ